MLWTKDLVFKFTPYGGLAASCCAGTVIVAKASTLLPQ